MRYKNGPKLNFFLMPITFIIHHQKFDCNKCQFFLLWALYICLVNETNGIIEPEIDAKPTTGNGNNKGILYS